MIQILDSRSSIKVKKNLDDLNLDIYYDLDFLEIEADLHKGVFEIFTYRESGELFIYPYIFVSLPFPELADYLDITSPYGYGGPIFISNDKAFNKRAEKKFIEYIEKKKVISEFIRYNYDLGYHFELNCQNLEERTIVIVDLKNGWNHIWMKEFSAKTRNLTRKLDKEGFQFEKWEGENKIIEFYQMYLVTMNNANAADFYYFDISYFYQLFEKLADKLILFRVVKDGITYAASLFFAKGDYFTYFLSARNTNYNRVAGNNFLLSKAIEWAKSQGFREVNLGGGLTNNPEDSLFKFKKNFSSNTKSFYIGKRIINEEKYELIKQLYIERLSLEKYLSKKNILQFYR